MSAVLQTALCTECCTLSQFKGMVWGHKNELSTCSWALEREYQSMARKRNHITISGLFALKGTAGFTLAFVCFTEAVSMSLSLRVEFQGQKIWPQHFCKIINKWMSGCQTTNRLTSSKVYTESGDKKALPHYLCILVNIISYYCWRLITSLISPLSWPWNPGTLQKQQCLNCLFFQHTHKFAKVTDR